MLKGETEVILFLFCCVNKTNEGFYIKLSFNEMFLQKHFNLDLSYFILSYQKIYLNKILFSFKIMKSSIVNVFILI